MDTNEYHQYKRLSGFAPWLLNWLVFFWLQDYNDRGSSPFSCLS